MKRRAVRVGRTRSEKRIREAVKESRRLHRAQFDAPLVELEKPYQRGWMRYFRLTEQATRRSDIELLEELLPYVDHISFAGRGNSKPGIPTGPGGSLVNIALVEFACGSFSSCVFPRDCIATFDSRAVFVSSIATY